MKKLFIFLSIISALNATAVETLDPKTNQPLEKQYQEEIINNTHIISSERITEAKQDSARKLIQIFYEDQYRNSKDPESPYFIFLSKDSKWAMGMGGVIRMRAWYDLNGAMPSNGFIPYFIPIPKDPTSHHNIGGTPAGVAAFLTILGKHSSLGNVMAFLQGGFDGYQNRDFKLKKAYVIINNLTIGYALSTFADASILPITIDGAGPNGSINKTQMLMRYFKQFKSGWGLSGSIEIPSSQINDDIIYTKKCPNYIPDLVLLSQYQWNQNLNHIRLSGLLHFSSYRNMIINSNQTVCGWGTQLSGSIKLATPTTIYFQTCYGKGIGSYMQELQVAPFDLLTTPTKNGKMYAPHSLGITVGIRHYFNKNIYANIVLSEMRLYAKTKSEPDTYKYGLYGAANIYWDISSRFQLGTEYLIGKRKNINHTNGIANRINVLFQLSF